MKYTKTISHNKASRILIPILPVAWVIKKARWDGCKAHKSGKPVHESSLTAYGIVWILVNAPIVSHWIICTGIPAYVG